MRNSLRTVPNQGITKHDTCENCIGRTHSHRCIAGSCGATRAAAMAYDVMEELRDTNILVDGQSRRLLDKIDYISSVSGGSFTAAYYGLHGEQMFDIFEDEFLRFNLQSKWTPQPNSHQSRNP